MKQALRQSIIAARARMAEDSHQRFSREITARLLQLDVFCKANTVLGYMHFGAEFVSAPWLRRVLADGKVLLLPRANKAAGMLELYHVSDLATQLVPGSYGIREPHPERCERAKLDDVDLILLPGVAFGRNGARLGYGGGYYDKLLAGLTHRPVLVAAAFELQVVEDIPMEPTDQRVDWLVTENETIDCRRAGK